MNVKTEARPETINNGRDATQKAIEPKQQSRRSLWVALAAAVSCAGIAAAVALGAFDSSSTPDVDPAVSNEDVVGGDDSNQEPAAPYGSGLPHEAH